MNLPTTRIFAAVFLVPFVCQAATGLMFAQNLNEAPLSVAAPSPSLGLTPEKTSYLKEAVAEHDYLSAEKMLIGEIEQNPHSLRSAPLLGYLGSIYFLNRDYLSAAVAWKKSGAITPLNAGLRFSLAMAYIEIAHPDWARALLEALAAEYRRNALYAYWLGRLDYDAHRYPEGVLHFQRAIILDPNSGRAYDNLGLCYFQQNENVLAIANFEQAIKLDRTLEHPSPWPYLNLAETQRLLNQTQEAEANIREAIRLDPQLSIAHYRLAKVLETQGRLEVATSELLEAIRIDNRYADAHIALAQIYNRLKRKEDAAHEVQIYRTLRSDPTSKTR